MILKNSEIIKYTSKEISHFREDPDTYRPLRIHNKLLNRLKNHYYCDEFTEHFYDWEEHDDGTPMTDQERMGFCNWVEPMFEGNWGITQPEVDRWALNQLKACRKWNVDKSHRFYIKDEDDIIEIYAFGRDEYYSDFWWIYKKNGKEKNTGLPVTL